MPELILRHFPSFEGKQNFSKLRVLLLLYDRWANQDIKDGLLCSEISEQTGVPIPYLRQKLLRLLCKWGYIKRYRAPGDYRYRYIIGTKGSVWLHNVVRDHYPHALMRAASHLRQLTLTTSPNGDWR